MVGGRGEENRDCVVEGLFGERENRESILDKLFSTNLAPFPSPFGREQSSLYLCYI